MTDGVKYCKPRLLRPAYLMRGNETGQGNNVNIDKARDIDTNWGSLCKPHL